MTLSVVVVSWNTREWSLRCLAALDAALDGIDGEVIFVDNGSTDGTAEAVARRFPAVRLLRNGENRGYAVATNQGARVALGDHVLLLNSDTELDRDALREMLRVLEEDPQAAGVAPRLVHEDGRVQEACMRFPKLRTAFAFGTPAQRRNPDGRELRRYFARDFDYHADGVVDQPPAACLMLRRSVWEALGGFDESLWLFFNDVDFCRRLAQSGARLRYASAARCVHAEGASTSRFEGFVEQWQRDRLRYYRKHFGLAGVVAVKLAVTWTFADWWVRTAWTRVRGREAEALAPTSRAFASFLFCA